MNPLPRLLGAAASHGLLTGQIVFSAAFVGGMARGVPVSLCGDMASSPQHAAALLDAGLRCFSCAPAQVAAVKTAIAAHSLKSVV